MSVFVKTENHGVLNLRAEPSTSASILARIPYGTEIPAEKIDDVWAKVKYNGQEGYVMMKFLSTEEPKQVNTITRESLVRIYNSLKSTLDIIEEVLK